MPFQPQQQHEALCYIDVVIHHENASALGRLERRGSTWRRRWLRRRRGTGQANSELTALAGPGTGGGDLAAMALYQGLHQCEPDSQPALRTVQEMIALHK